MNDALVLASMLHDVGKVVRRAEPAEGNHIIAGCNFLKKLELDIENFKLILEAIENHHYKDLVNAKFGNNHIAYILYEADNIASGIDRRKYSDDSIGNEMAPMESVFNVLNQKKGLGTKKHGIKINLENEMDIPKEKSSLLTQSEYQGILEKLKRNFKEIDFNNEGADTLLSIYENLLKNIPSSSYIDVPDISLYDHLKMTAAISDCLFKYYNFNKQNDFKSVCFENNSEYRKEKQFVLVSGNLSGIQNFIYTITSKHAMKSLRGRSSYLELLTENIVDEILSELKMTRVNLIYSGGGHFYVLLPNTEMTKDVLNKAKETINDWLLEKYNIQLYFELNYQECSSDDLGNELSSKIKNNNLVGDIYRNVSNEISKGKINDILIKEKNLDIILI